MRDPDKKQHRGAVPYSMLNVERSMLGVEFTRAKAKDLSKVNSDQKNVYPPGGTVKLVWP